MPAIISMEQEHVWLDPAIRDPMRLLPLLKPYPAAEMESYEVSALVNSVANDSPECLSRVTPSLPSQPLLPFFES